MTRPSDPIRTAQRFRAEMHEDRKSRRVEIAAWTAVLVPITVMVGLVLGTVFTDPY